MTKPSDSDLVVQLQNGNLEALGDIYDRHRHLVYRTALAITGDHEAASDLLQDVFLRLHRFSAHIDVARPLEPWLYRMTTNLSYTWVKRSRRWLRPLEELADWLVGDGSHSDGARLEEEDDWRMVQQAISALPLPQRVVVVLYYLNDLSLQEIAEILEVPSGTIKSRLHYGRLSLKKSLGMQLDGLPDLNLESS
jgi:RNA polymerase sigma-70 factor (ECF subfamily)